MVSTPTLRNRFDKQATGDNTNTWGDRLNSGVFDLIDASLDGLASVPVSGSVTLTSVNYADDQARRRVLKLTGTGGTVTLPAVEKWYLVWNAGSGTQTIACAGGGTSVPVAVGEITVVICDAVNVTRLSPLTFSGAAFSFTGGPVSFGAQRLTGLADPAANQDAATKKYVDETAFTANSGVLPGQPGSAGKFLTTNGAAASWGAPAVSQISDYASDQITRHAATLASASAVSLTQAIAFAVAL